MGPGKIKINPKLRKMAITRVAKRKKALVDLRSQRRVLMADMREVRTRLADFKRSIQNINSSLSRHESELAQTQQKLVRVEANLDTLQRSIESQKALTGNIPLTRKMALSTAIKTQSALKKYIRGLDRTVSRAEVAIQLNTENLRAAKTELTAIHIAGEAINVKIKKLTKQ